MERWISARGQVVYVEKREPIRLVGATLDITERKKAAEALQESEERLRLFIDYAPAARAMCGTRNSS